jgi:hypothetical protein
VIVRFGRLRLSLALRALALRSQAVQYSISWLTRSPDLKSLLVAEEPDLFKDTPPEGSQIDFRRLGLTEPSLM